MLLKVIKMTDCFFKRPIVLISAIVILLQAVAKFAISMLGYGVLSWITERELYDIDIFELVIGVCLLLFYIFAKRNKPLDFPIKFIKVASIVELIVVIILLCCVLLAVMCLIFIGIISTGIMLIRFVPMLIITPAIIVGIYIVVFTVIISTTLLFVSQLMFAVSLKKDIVLQKHRSASARFYAVMNFINAALLISSVIILLLLDITNTSYFTLTMLISSPSCVLIGIMAVKYSRINRINKTTV